MNACAVQRIFAAGDAHKARALLKRLRSEFCYFQELFSALKTAVLLAVCHDVFRNHLADTGNVFQQRCGCRIQIHTDFIDAVLNDTAKRLAELLLVHIVLILADTDGFRIDFDKLCQRVLHAACDGSGASLSDIKVREFLCGKLACGVNGCSRLVGDHVRNLLRDLF